MILPGAGVDCAAERHCGRARRRSRPQSRFGEMSMPSDLWAGAAQRIRGHGAVVKGSREVGKSTANLLV